MPSNSPLSPVGRLGIQVNSMPQFVLVTSSAKSIEKPSTLRLLKRKATSWPPCQTKSRRPYSPLPPARSTLRPTPVTEPMDLTFPQRPGFAYEQPSLRKGSVMSNSS
jgi:hypothetical protein